MRPSSWDSLSSAWDEGCAGAWYLDQAGVRCVCVGQEEAEFCALSARLQAEAQGSCIAACIICEVRMPLVPPVCAVSSAGILAAPAGLPSWLLSGSGDLNGDK
eukprot:6478551-Amphidinium_carterae.2